MASLPCSSQSGFTTRRSLTSKFAHALAAAPTFPPYIGETSTTRRRSGFARGTDLFPAPEAQMQPDRQHEHRNTDELRGAEIRLDEETADRVTAVELEDVAQDRVGAD